MTKANITAEKGTGFCEGINGFIAHIWPVWPVSGHISRILSLFSCESSLQNSSSGYFKRLDSVKVFPKIVSLMAPVAGHFPIHSPHIMHSAEKTVPFVFWMDILLDCIGHSLLQDPQDRHFVLSFSSLRGLIMFNQPKSRPQGQKLHQNRTMKGAVITSRKTRIQPGSNPIQKCRTK